MRLLLELFAVFFAVMTIYRRLVEPFIDGVRSRAKVPSTESSGRVHFTSKTSKKNIQHADPKQIQDAEFEEIK